MSDTVTPETLEGAVKAAQAIPVDTMGFHRYASPLREQIEAAAPVLLAPVLARLEESEAQLAAARETMTKYEKLSAEYWAIAKVLGVDGYGPEDFAEHIRSLGGSNG